MTPSSSAHRAFGADPAADATVAATLLDALVVDEISLVPSGGNQRADIVATKSATGAPVALSAPAAGFLDGIKRAMHAVLAKVAPSGGEARDLAAAVDDGLSDAAASLVLLDTPAVAKTATAPSESPTVPSAPNGAPSTAELPAMTATATDPKTPPTPTVPDESVQKVHEAIAKAQALAEENARIAKAHEDIAKANLELQTRLAVLEKAAQESVLKAEYAETFGGIAIAKDQEPAMLTLLAKANEAEKAALRAFATHTVELGKTAALVQEFGGASAPTSLGRVVKNDSGTAHAEADAAAQALVQKEGLTYAAAYSKALDLNPGLATRVLNEERAVVSGAR